MGVDWRRSFTKLLLEKDVLVQDIMLLVKNSGMMVDK